MQAWLFTATYITILPTILSSGYLADRYGPKYVCLFALLLFVFSTITAPELAKWHYGALMADRSLIGMAENGVFIAIIYAAQFIAKNSWALIAAEVQPWAKPTPIEPIASIESNQLKKSQPDEIPIPLRERL
uniref:Major facilitator superfamily (MFS) profile domain-containing protein n=1 Tax=Acrobeloides nanus TaxID=290746 RepID=A0A914E655_9BILA